MIYQLQKHILYSISVILILCIFSFPLQLNGQNKSQNINQEPTTFVYKKLSTPNPTIEAEALYRYLQNIFGEQILSGQMSASWGVNELEYIRRVTGKQPAIKGIEFIHDSNNKAELQNAIEWWKAGGIPCIMWQCGIQSSREGVRSRNKEIDLNRCFVEGTPENTTMWSEFKMIANHLEVLRDNNVPVLWCPFYELEGRQNDIELHKKLWRTMFTYCTTERKLNNLIWVFGFNSDTKKILYPGNNYVDITGAAISDNKSDPQQNIFNRIEEINLDNRTPIAYQVCRTIPDPDKCLKEGARWSWWMQWHTADLENMEKDYLKKVYNHKSVVTLNDVPDIVKEYSNDLLKRDFNTGRIIPFSELKAFHIGIKPVLGNLTIRNDKIEITAGGADIWGKKDQCYFVFKQFEGDFDISVQVHSLFAAHMYTKAGIMARADLSKNSKHVFFQVFPDNSARNKNSGGCEFQYRPEKAKETKAIYPDPATAGNKFDVNFPNTWIRLTRKGDTFKSYISNDNINWHIYAKHKQKMPNKLLLGLAVTSHDPNENTKAEFSNLFVTWQR